MNALSARGLEFTTTAGFADYRERMSALNNSLGFKLVALQRGLAHG